ncbi:MAG: hypothetical protein QOI10_1433 [Solirubrobacterales bacterium]|jgi:response regulator RpfG family c-di-GMP phosphodiesterase|nr:hypothetical protein [Solirubrobacterales bacterium]
MLGPSPAALWASTGADGIPTDLDPAETIDRVLEAAREMLDMDMAYLADTRDDKEHYRGVAGDGDSFGSRTGEAGPLEGTYCQLMLAGSLPNIVRDSAEEPLVSTLEITAKGRIGSYVGVPVKLSDGSVFGTFCCLSHAPSPELEERDLRFMHILAQLIADQLEKDERTTAAWKQAAAAGSVQALLGALEARDGYTGDHSQAVVELAVAIGRSLDLDEAQLGELEIVALLHDIGKIGVPDQILRKAGKLTEEEWTQIRRHPVIGEGIVAAMPPLAHLAPCIRGEHERWDGGGYPDGLEGEEIPQLSRIVLVSDAYHAMTSERPYRSPMPVAEAIAELERNAGSQFCPRTAAAACVILRAGPQS